jgi:hypothetical protein
VSVVVAVVAVVAAVVVVAVVAVVAVVVAAVVAAAGGAVAVVVAVVAVVVAAESLNGYTNAQHFLLFLSHQCDACGSFVAQIKKNARSWQLAFYVSL